MKNFLLICLMMVMVLGLSVIPASAQGVETKLIATDGAKNDYFGASTSVSGDTVVIGAEEDDDWGTNSGAAYVFMYDGSNWVEKQKLTAGPGSARDRFGTSVAIDGDIIVVGAIRDDDKAYNAGAAYVFAYENKNWVEKEKLTAGDGAAVDYFGTSVSISGETIVVGAKYEDARGFSSGSAYLFTYQGSSWVEEKKLFASDGAAYDFFGASVSISGETVVVGAEGDDGSSGAAYLFIYDGKNWTEKQKLTASDRASGDNFGASVAVSGDSAVIGAKNDDDNGANSGSAYLFMYGTKSWTQEQKLTAGDGAGGDNFGVSVAISDDTIIVGAEGDDDGGGDSGSAYVFMYDGKIWTQQQKLTASDQAGGDNYGVSVAVSGDSAVAGAKYDDDKGSNSGSAYVYYDLTARYASLVRQVKDLNMSRRSENSLLVKVDSSMNAVFDKNEGNDHVAIKNLGSFMNEVEAQRGKRKISSTAANGLIATAQSMIAHLGGG